MQAPLLPTGQRPSDFPDVDAYRQWRAKDGVAKQTLSAECSQLRSLARDAAARLGLTLADLRDEPAVAANLIEDAGGHVSLPTIQTRVRAFQRFLQMGVSPYLGRQRIATFMAGFPRRKSRGWHDMGSSLSGGKARRRMPAPTPGSSALLRILATACEKSNLDGAVASLCCFSGLDLQEITALRWRDVKWLDDGNSPIWEVKVHREGQGTSCFVMSPGAHPLLRFALASDRARDAYLFPGRAEGTHLTVVSMRHRLANLCHSAGWPGLSRWQLLSALASWLREAGVSDHEIRLAFGRRRALTVDRLLKPHDRLNAQALVDEQVFPQS